MLATINNPSIGPILVNGTDYAAQTKSFWCTDEDLTFGIGKFQITLADKDGTIGAAFPAWPSEVGCWKSVSITANANTLFTGLTEKVTHQVGAGGNEVVFEGYNKGSELLNLFITKDYSQVIGPRADLFLKDVMFSAGKTPQFVTGPVVAGPVPGSYPAAAQTPGDIKQRYMSDIMREVLTAIGYAGNIDTGGVFNMFNPVNPQQNGLVITNANIQSVYPTDTQAYTNQYKDSNVKDGNTVRDLHETKNYLEFTGAGNGYDPKWNGLTTNPSNWSANLVSPAWSVNWVLDTGDLNAPPVIDVPHSIIGIVNTPALGYSIPIVGQYNFNSQTYGVKNDVDQVNCLLNIVFNHKTGLHFWTTAQWDGGGAVGPTMGVTFTDTGNATATLASPVTLTSSGAWQEFNLPTPLPGYNAWAAGQADPYAYGGAFNFSSIANVQFTFTPATATAVQFVRLIGFNSMYFVCQPFYVPYVNPERQSLTTPNVVDTTYGERDQAVNAGAAYVNQLDLQAFGDTAYNSYISPMLRSMLTVVVDPQVMHLQAGKSIGLEIPRWQYNSPLIHSPGGIAQYWRIVQVRTEGSNKGLFQKIDVIPSSAI